MQELKSSTASNETNTKNKGFSKMAELMALHRFAESRKPEGERIYYDPYAIYFVDPETLSFEASNPEKTKEMSEYYERLFPFWGIPFGPE